MAHADDAKTKSALGAQIGGQIERTIVQGGQDARTTLVSNTTDYQFTVPALDFRSQDLRVVGFSAADTSKTGIALVLYGEGGNMYEAANRAVHNAREKDNAPVSIVLADEHPSLQGNPGMAIYIGGHRALPAREERPLTIPQERRDHAYYYTTSMQVALEAYQEARRTAEANEQQTVAATTASLRQGPVVDYE